MHLIVIMLMSDLQEEAPTDGLSADHFEVG